jgi:hypothetical protein
VWSCCPSKARLPALLFKNDRSRQMPGSVYHFCSQAGTNYFHITLIINQIQRCSLRRSRKILLFAYISLSKNNYSYNILFSSSHFINLSSPRLYYSFHISQELFIVYHFITSKTSFKLSYLGGFLTI